MKEVSMQIYRIRKGEITPSHPSGKLMVDRQGHKVDLQLEECILTSMKEETLAARVYRERAKSARVKGYVRTAELWEHIAKEEDGHWRELSEELRNVRKGVE
jgi:rubrerythrin